MDSTPLFSLLRKKQYDKAFALARATPALVNAGTPDDPAETPLLWALRFADAKAALELLALGGDVARTDEEGLTPVEVACDGGINASQAQVDARTALVELLLAKGAPIGGHALYRATNLGAGKARALVKLLCAAKAPIATEEGETLLHAACAYDQPEALEAGLKAGLDPNEATPVESYDGGTTALHVAVKKKREALVARLVAAGADPERKNKRGDTPRSLATGALKKVLAGDTPAPAAAPPAKKASGPEALVAAIWAAPRDKAALAVWADWLAESGERGRGEYVSLRLLDKPGAEQKKRAAALLAKERGKWLGAARKLVSEWTDSETTPGFVAEATVNVDNLLSHFDAVCALGPELVVRVTPIKTRLLTKKLAERPLGRLYGLSLYNTTGTYSMNRDWLDDTSLGILGPSLAGLRALALAPCIQANDGEGFTAAAFGHLALAGATLEQLVLDFEGGRPGRALLAAILPAAFPKLRSLTVRGLETPQRAPIRKAFAGTAVSLVFA